MYTVAYTLPDEGKTSMQEVPEAWVSVYSYANFLTRMLGVKEIRIYHEGLLVEIVTSKYDNNIQAIH